VPGTALPSIRFYQQFPEVWDSLPIAIRKLLGQFLERLQRDPFDESLQAESEANPPFFATRFAPGYTVYWSLAFPANSSIEHPPEPHAIDILSIRRDDKSPDSEA
jgi:hypothetical protein